MSSEWKPLWEPHSKTGNYQQKVDRLVAAGWIYAGDRPGSKKWLSPYNKTFMTAEASFMQQKKVDKGELHLENCKVCSKPVLSPKGVTNGSCWFCQGKQKQLERGYLTGTRLGAHIYLSLEMTEIIKPISKTAKKSMTAVVDELLKAGLEASQ